MEKKPGPENTLRPRLPRVPAAGSRERRLVKEDAAGGAGGVGNVGEGVADEVEAVGGVAIAVHVGAGAEEHGQTGVGGGEHVDLPAAGQHLEVRAEGGHVVRHEGGEGVARVEVGAASIETEVVTVARDDVAGFRRGVDGMAPGVIDVGGDAA